MSNKNLFINISYNTISNVISLLLGFILNIIIARILQPKQMGEYSYAVWLISFLSIVILLGVPNTLTKYISQFYKEKNKIRFLFYFLVRIVFLTFIFVSSGILIYFFISQKNFDFLIFVVLGYTIASLNGILRSYVSGIEDFKTITINTFITLFLQLILVITFLKKEPSSAKMLEIYLFSLFISTILFFISLKKELKEVFSTTEEMFLEKDEKKKITKYLIFISALMLINMIVWERSEIFFLKIFSTSEGLAFYSIAFTLGYLPNKILTFGNVLLPRMSKFYAEKDFSKISMYYKQLTEFISLLIIPIYIFVFMFASDIVKILYGESYLQVSSILRIIIFAGIISGIATVGSAFIQAVEKVGVSFKIGVFITVINILLDFLLIPKYRSIGAAYANSISQILGCFLGTGYILYNFKFRFPFLKIVKFLVISYIIGKIVKLYFSSFSCIGMFILFFVYILSFSILNYKEIFKNINFIYKSYYE
jgi:O-antigen/teichoic acid export membrane protein